MDNSAEIVLRTTCCTCLSVDRKLFQLCRINDGVNNLYSLLSYDSEAYREGFYKDIANMFICWECEAIMRRIYKFRQQACIAQKNLTYIAEGRNDLKNKCLSNLSRCQITHTEIVLTNTEFDNFVDCGPITDSIKTESDEDIPLSEFNNHMYYDDNKFDEDTTTEDYIETANKKIEESKKKKGKTKKNKEDKYYNVIYLSKEEMMECREKRKLAVNFLDAIFKCEMCIEVFNDETAGENHNLAVHTEKNNHTQCEVCSCYIKNNSQSAHRDSHYVRYNCSLCDIVAYDITGILKHLKNVHAIKHLVVPARKKKGIRKTPAVMKPGSKPRRNQAMMDKRTPFGYLCTECNKYFDNKNQRWKHVQRHHREGFKCSTCGKRFAFKNNLSRHELVHGNGITREQCPTCGRMIRSDLFRVHARIHASRESHACVACDKRFVSRASYEHHLKYTRAHAKADVLKYKCSQCDKGYRSRGELRDHVNYLHMATTLHKCPVCGKALATRRCIRRHVKRAHEGVKESARDKICQQCGKAFRDKKGLREHEAIHTGERPLSCEICGCTFRQSASLYTHKKRVHKIHPVKRKVQLMETETV